MKEVYKGLYVGSEDDVPKAEDRGYAILSCCKDGKHSHRGLLGYESMGAPKGPEYLFARRKDHLFLNLIDGDNPDYVPDKLVNEALAFITEQLDKGKSVLVHCVEGKSRGPSIALLWLGLNGKISSLRLFRLLYPDYDPSPGIKLYTKARLAARR